MIVSAETAWKRRAIEAEHKLEATREAQEADKKAFSDAAERTIGAVAAHSHAAEVAALYYLSPFILPEPEPDPLDQLLDDTAKVMLSGPLSETWHEALRKAARGYRIERIEQ